MHTDDNPNNLFSISTGDFKKETCPMCGHAEAIILCQDRQKYVGIVESIQAHAKIIEARQNILFWRGSFVCAVTWLLLDLFFRFVIHAKNETVWEPLSLVFFFGLMYMGLILKWKISNWFIAKKQAKKAIEQLIVETGNKE